MASQDFFRPSAALRLSTLALPPSDLELEELDAEDADAEEHAAELLLPDELELAVLPDELELELALELDSRRLPLDNRFTPELVPPGS